MDKITGIKMTFNEFAEAVESATDGEATAIKERTWFFGGMDESGIEDSEILECLTKHLNVNTIKQIVVNCDKNDLDNTVIIVYQ